MKHVHGTLQKSPTDHPQAQEEIWALYISSSGRGCSLFFPSKVLSLIPSTSRREKSVSMGLLFIFTLEKVIRTFVEHLCISFLGTVRIQLDSGEITILPISGSVALRGDEAIITLAKNLWDCKGNQLVAQPQCGCKWQQQQMSHQGCQGAVTTGGSTELSASWRTVYIFVVFAYLLVYLLCSHDSHCILKLGHIKILLTQLQPFAHISFLLHFFPDFRAKSLALKFLLLINLLRRIFIYTHVCRHTHRHTSLS